MNFNVNIVVFIFLDGGVSLGFFQCQSVMTGAISELTVIMKRGSKRGKEKKIQEKGRRKMVARIKCIFLRHGSP